MTQNWSHLLLQPAQELHRHLRNNRESDREREKERERERERERLPSLEKGGTQEGPANTTTDTIRRRKNQIHPMIHNK
jgi:hypothetical protein